MAVLNKYHLPNQEIPPNAEYIGRPSKWGNPFALNPLHSRAYVITQFERYIRSNPKLMEAAKRELKGKDLVCFCAPLPCHGDVLHRIANEE
jgi:hypothetical protein